MHLNGGSRKENRYYVSASMGNEVSHNGLAIQAGFHTLRLAPSNVTVANQIAYAANLPRAFLPRA